MMSNTHADFKLVLRVIEEYGKYFDKLKEGQECLEFEEWVKRKLKES